MTKFMTQAEYAAHRGISQPRISKLLKTGQIPAGCMKKISGRKLIDRDKADAALSENLDRMYNPNPAKKGMPKSKPKKPSKPSKPEMARTAERAGTQGMSMSDAQRLQAQYKAALLKLDYEERSGKLISAQEVEVSTFNFARVVRDAVLNIPDRISAELASCTDVHAVNQKLTESLIEALEELSGKLKSA